MEFGIQESDTQADGEYQAKFDTNQLITNQHQHCTKIQGGGSVHCPSSMSPNDQRTSQHGFALSQYLTVNCVYIPGSILGNSKVSLSFAGLEVSVSLQGRECVGRIQQSREVPKEFLA